MPELKAAPVLLAVGGDYPEEKRLLGSNTDVLLRGRFLAACGV